MAVNRSRAVRTDLPYLSRRVKPRAAAAPATTPEARPTTPAAPASAGTSASSGTLASSGTPAGPPRTTPAPAAPAPGSLSLSPPSRPQAAPPTVSTSLSLGLSPNAEAHSNRATTSDAGSRGSGAPSSSAPSPSAAAPAAAPSAPAPLHTRLFPAPGIRELRTLDTSNPVLRLTPMESAVGSLAVAGTIRAVWEGLDFSTGSQPAPGPGIPAGAFEGVAVDTPGNRRLVSYEDDLALITLRHAGMLRRALFFPKPKQPMNVGLFNGESVTIPASAGERSFYVLSVLRIGTVLELRAEVLPYGMELKSIWEAFGFTLTARFPFQGN